MRPQGAKSRTRKSDNVCGCATSTRSSRPTTSAARIPTSSTRTLPTRWGPPSCECWGPLPAMADRVPSWWRTTCVRRVPSLVASFADGVREQGCDVILIGLASTDGLYFASGRLSLPGRHVHGQSQSRPLQRDQAVPSGAAPVGQDTGLRDHPPDDRRRASPPSTARSAASASRTCWPSTPQYLRALVDVSSIAPAEGRRRRRQRHGRLHRARGARHGGRAACPPARHRPDVLRARRHLPEPRGEPDRSGEPARPAGAGARDLGADLGLGLRRRRRSLLRRRRARRARQPVHPDRAHRRA